MRWGRGDNYCYILTDDKTKESWVIDPAQPEEVIPVLAEKFSGLKFTAVVNTHHHYDHSDGNTSMLEYFKKIYGEDLPVYAGEDSPKVTLTPKHLDHLSLGTSIEIQAIHTPCHTMDSICWYAVDKHTGEKVLFSGDTIFHLGNGRFFEGTGAQMTKVMMETIPDNVDKQTKIYPGHEYTASNAEFAKSVMPKSIALSNYISKFTGKEFTCGMFNLQDELDANPFFRLDDPEILIATKGQGKSQSEIMDTLRTMKNKF